MLMKHLNLGPLNWTEQKLLSVRFNLCETMWKCQSPFPELQELGFESSQEIENKEGRDTLNDYLHW